LRKILVATDQSTLCVKPERKLSILQYRAPGIVVGKLFYLKSDYAVYMT